MDTVKKPGHFHGVLEVQCCSFSGFVPVSVTEYWCANASIHWYLLVWKGINGNINISTEIVVLPVYGKAELWERNGLYISRRVSGAEVVIFPVPPGTHSSTFLTVKSNCTTFVLGLCPTFLPLPDIWAWFVGEGEICRNPSVEILQAFFFSFFVGQEHC